jgi:hypothetical protein
VLWGNRGYIKHSAEGDEKLVANSCLACSCPNGRMHRYRVCSVKRGFRHILHSAIYRVSNVVGMYEH